MKTKQSRVEQSKSRRTSQSSSSSQSPNRNVKGSEAGLATYSLDSSYNNVQFASKLTITTTQWENIVVIISNVMDVIGRTVETVISFIQTHTLAAGNVLEARAVTTYK